jgi:hypothetical protein
MKKLCAFLTAVLIATGAMAQVPEKMSYQAVVRDADNTLLTSQTVGMQISILQGSITGSAVYVETHVPTTNNNGLVSLEIGSGTIVSGVFSTIDWSNGPYFIKTETDPAGGTNYTISGTSQLLSVPYALHAKTAETLSGVLAEIDPVFAASIANGIEDADTTNWNNHTINTDTQLDSAGVTALGFAAGAHTIDTDTQLDSTGVATLGYVAGMHTIDTDSQLDSTGVAVLGYVAGPHPIVIDSNNNLFLGNKSGYSNVSGADNVFIGTESGYLNYDGSRNTFLGYDAGYNIHNGSGNVFIGHEAGKYANGINNRLIIENENIDSTKALIYGEFDQNHLRINGNVGINYQAYNSYGLIVDIPDGQTSIYTLLIYGNAWASGGTWSTSDVRYKKNVNTFMNALDKLQKLRGVSFDWNIDQYPELRFSDRNQIGFIAQEVEEIFPELVKEDHEGYKAIDYSRFTPIIVEAMKEQQQEIEDLQQEIIELNVKLRAILDKLEQ